jgi:hypothetical protein
MSRTIQKEVNVAAQVLKDKRGNKLGEIREAPGGRLAIYDTKGNKLGEYDPKSNVTKDTRGNKVGQGNLLTSLLVHI